MQPSSPPVELHRIRRARPLLGTRVEIEVGSDQGEECLHAAVDAAFACIERIHQLMSYQSADSDLSRLNGRALHGAHRVHAHTYRVCEAALDFARASAGAFDPTLAWRSGADWRDVELCGDDRIRYHRPLHLDLGGIAKGYAVDLAVEQLQALYMEQVLVNAGGDLRVGGTLPQFVHLRHPAAPLQSAHVLVLQDAALATSAAYFSGESSALIDPRSGESYVGTRSASVRAKSCLCADALTKVMLFAAPARSEACLAKHGANAYILQQPA